MRLAQLGAHPKDAKKPPNWLDVWGIQGKVMDSHMEPLEECLKCPFCYGFVSFWRKEMGGSLQ